MFESIGPVWDGNEVWLVVAGGATFAAFPAWYATMFSGFYLALLLVLVCLIVRVVSFEWRTKTREPRWRAVWTWANAIGSFGASLVWGVGLSTSSTACRSTHGDYAGNFWNLFNGYTVLARARGRAPLRLPRRDLPDAADDRRALRARATAARGLSIPAAVGAAALLVSTVFGRGRPQRQERLPAACSRRRSGSRRSLLAASFVLGSGRAAGRSRSTGLGAILRRRDALHEPLPARDGLEPRLREQPHRRRRASSPHYTLAVMTVVALICVPLVLALPGLDVPRLPAPGRRRERTGDPMRRSTPACCGARGPAASLLAVDAALGVGAGAARPRARRSLLADVIVARAFDGASLRGGRAPSCLVAARSRVFAARALLAWGFEVAGRRAARRRCSRSCGSTSSRRGCATSPAALDGAESGELAAARRHRGRRARDDFAALPAAGRARRRRPARGARARRRDRPDLGRDHAADAAARPGLHVADRPLHRAARTRALAGARACSRPTSSTSCAGCRRCAPSTAARRRPSGSSRSASEYRRATMGTLRVAFLSGSVLELAATLGVALVAVTVGVRLVDGAIGLRGRR